MSDPAGAPVDVSRAAARAFAAAAADGGYAFTPSTPGVYTLTYTATDAAARQNQVTFTVAVSAAPGGGENPGGGTNPGGGGTAPGGTPGAVNPGSGDPLAATGGTVPALAALGALALLAAGGFLVWRRQRRSETGA